MYLRATYYGERQVKFLQYRLNRARVNKKCLLKCELAITLNKVGTGRESFTGSDSEIDGLPLGPCSYCSSVLPASHTIKQSQNAEFSWVVQTNDCNVISQDFLLSGE